MMAARRDPNSDASSGVDHLDDLRAQLPAEFRDTSDGEIARLWVAWDAARHGHPVAYLTDTLDVPDEVAERLVTLAGHDLTDRCD
jgi:hypothetical protein